MLAITVDVNENDVRKFYQERKLTLPWYPDPGRRVANKYNVSVFPETFLIDRNGYVVKHYPGPINTQIMGQIENLLLDQEATQRVSAR
jgi:peroxiredoxin